MRHDPTPAESILWKALRGRQLAGFKFRRQHPIDRFIVDFYCADAHLVIEVDGDIHTYTEDEDAIRQQFIESRGLHVLRFRNQQIEDDLNNVLDAIHSVLESSTQGNEDYPHPPAPL
jgi:very-short-patch-repair endonuclease